MVFGATAAWREADAKRLLGYSSTSQLGFVLMGMGWGTRASMTAAILFMVHHSLSKCLLFLSTGILADRAGSTRLEVLAGQGTGLPWIKTAFLLGFISLVGLPPALGFVGKLAIVNAGIQAGAWVWVAMVLAGSLMTLLYGGRIYQSLFWQPAEQAGRVPAFDVHTLIRCSIAFLSLLIIAAGITGAPVWTLAERAADAIGGGR
jgi:multicomponent Na+:H+ antiporter subunit D